jgi:hypothetical protein
VINATPLNYQDLRTPERRSLITLWRRRRRSLINLCIYNNLDVYMITLVSLHGFAVPISFSFVNSIKG